MLLHGEDHLCQSQLYSVANISLRRVEDGWTFPIHFGLSIDIILVQFSFGQWCWWEFMGVDFVFMFLVIGYSVLQIILMLLADKVDSLISWLLQPFLPLFSKCSLSFALQMHPWRLGSTPFFFIGCSFLQLCPSLVKRSFFSFWVIGWGCPRDSQHIHPIVVARGYPQKGKIIPYC